MCFFFFQAEDGIRDKLVTGVQTCALPIYFRNRALGAGVALFFAALAALLLSQRWAPRVREALIFASWAVPLHLLTAAAALTALAALWRRRWRVARVAAATQVSLRSEEHTSELQSLAYLVCRLLL